MTNKKDTDDEIAALKARIEELEARTKPPEPPGPFKPAPYQRYDPTANMTMPPSVLREMARAVPDHMLRDIVRDNQAPTGRPGIIPEQSSSVRGSNVAGSGTGWVHEIPLGPPPGIHHVDAQLDAQDQKDLEERIQQETQRQAMHKFAEQAETLNRQIEAVSRSVEEPKP